MKKLNAYLVGMAMIFVSFIISEGCSKSNSSSSSTLIGNWTRASDFDGNARSEAVAFTIGDYAYISTGTTDRDRFKDLWEYSIARQYWSQKADLPGVARNSAVAFSLGTKGYVGTGFDGNVRVNDFWEFDPATNQWAEKADFAGTARYDAVAFALNGKGYISCGYDGNYLKDLWEFTPGASAADPGTWVQKASIGGTKRSAATAFVINNNGYICSGSNNGQILQDLWMYDQAEDTWTEKGKIFNATSDTYDDNYGTIPRQNGVAFVMNGLVYLTAGENTVLVSSTWEYNPSTDRWAEKTDFEGAARTGAVAFSLNNRGFVLTGRSGTLSMDDGYEFHPLDPKVDGD